MEKTNLEQLMLGASLDSKRENESPVQRSTQQLSQQGGVILTQNSKVFEMLLITGVSLLISSVPIIITALGGSSKENFLKLIFSNSDILFTVTTLSVTVAYDVLLMNVKEKRRLAKVILALLLFAIIIWNALMYIYLKGNQPNTHGAANKPQIIFWTLVVSVICLIVSIFVANWANDQNRTLRGF